MKSESRAFSKTEFLGIAILIALAAYFLGASWCKWPDPIVDTGSAMVWRVAESFPRARCLYHDELVWNYGPLSAFFNAGLVSRYSARA